MQIIPLKKHNLGLYFLCVLFISIFKQLSFVVVLQKYWSMGNSLAVQWLRFYTFTAEGLGLIPGQGTEIPQATCGMAKKIYCFIKFFF